MAQYPLNQTGHQRACQETEKFRKSAKSFWGLEIVGAVVLATTGSIAGYFLTPPNSTPFWQFAYPTFGGAFGLILGLIGVSVFIYGWYLFRAKYKQSDEARALLLAEPKPVPLRNRESLIRAIAVVKEKSIDLKMKQDDLNFKLKRREDPREELAERDNAWFAYLDARKGLETERLVAGDNFRAVIDNLIMFTDYHIDDCIGLVSTKDKPETLKTIPFMTQLDNNIEQAIRSLDALNLQASDKEGSQTRLA